MLHSDADYLLVMMAKLVDALLRKDTEQDGNWGMPSFREELEEMQRSLDKVPAVQNAPRYLTARV